MKSNNYTNITDQELLQRYYADHNKDWLGILLQRYTLLLLGVCMKYLKHEEEAKDSVQQVYLKVITELPKYKVQYFKSWIYMIARNHCLMKLRDRPGKTATPVNEELLAAQDNEETLEQYKEKDRVLELMELSLEELNGEQKQCVTLFYLDKKTYQQIAEDTGFSLMQVKSYIQNGKRNLRIILEKKLQQGPQNPLQP